MTSPEPCYYLPLHGFLVSAAEARAVRAFVQEAPCPSDEVIFQLRRIFQRSTHWETTSAPGHPRADVHSDLQAAKPEVQVSIVTAPESQREREQLDVEAAHTNRRGAHARNRGAAS